MLGTLVGFNKNCHLVAFYQQHVDKQPEKSGGRGVRDRFQKSYRWGIKFRSFVSLKAEDLAGNTWRHLKINPSFDAVGRIVQGIKELTESLMIMVGIVAMAGNKGTQSHMLSSASYSRDFRN